MGWELVVLAAAAGAWVAAWVAAAADTGATITTPTSEVYEIVTAAPATPKTWTWSQIGKGSASGIEIEIEIAFGKERGI